MASNHSRSASDENHNSMAYILEHVLQYPGSYDIPLKTMYELNRVDRAQPIPKNYTKSGNTSPISSSFAWNTTEAATMSFTSSLMNQLKALPTRTSALPPAFIVNFVTRTFMPEPADVDWSQALTALDYLKDLETRRRREMATTFEALDVHRDTWDADMARVAEKAPGIALWINNLEGKNRKAESYYAQLWVGLRRWIMINHLSDEEFNKLNCISYLNTLFPPVHAQTKLPSQFLNHEALKEERQIFFELISQVQRRGPDVLLPLINRDKRPEDQTGWPTVQRIVDKYLRVAQNMIQDCIATHGPESFDRYMNGPGKEKKHDSGVSFGSERRPSVQSSVHEKQSPEPMLSYTPSIKGLSKLERITREFKRMRVKPRPEVEEITQFNQRAAADHIPQTGANAGKKSLKKARSLASLKFGNGSSASLASRKGSDALAFDADEMKKHRAIYEASVSKSTHAHA
ncbi:uncharacterized protein J4E88_009042 [Alternaria novae-zelandiae]|uniref:uncharacterized protein n=1 Tax=Alternaria metachromatica TaxID=283354 RepID=UPI0020C4FD04|nr:uncharacterized protein J4E83_005014 [Alternaria metachromatica]XP_049198758.1 uncharacterized protein J4E93_006410 [Alternaria ventricosa]XP_049222031.1 uncharacterized protein J4E78_005688 [Alternaria triticimaculans]XP_049251502.1 uncharacterized protein J4E88_009042 [Alternaria novae-zelandiae]XP_051327793.1 uncharacterized protein J4E85_003938 [Alternaria conjuncta]XP_051354622.1 uncharacterized protein J4E92_004212 [Alternaria infectoria]KAI4613978.1 hypothetical protein J4E80_006667